MKQTFNTPAGCKTVSVEKVGNQIITSFEPEKYVPKKGDCVKIIYTSGNKYFCEVSDVKGYQICSKKVLITPEGIHFEDDTKYFTYDSIEKLTPEEFQAEFEKCGYVYDFETHTAKKKRWRAKLKRDYYYVSSSFDVVVDIENRHSVDAKRYNNGNYFETREECQKYCDYMRECSLKYFDK